MITRKIGLNYTLNVIKTEPKRLISVSYTHLTLPTNREV